MAAAGTPLQPSPQTLECIRLTANRRRPTVVEDKEGIDIGSQGIVIASLYVALQGIGRGGVQWHPACFAELDVADMQHSPRLRLTSARINDVASEIRKPVAAMSPKRVAQLA